MKVLHCGSINVKTGGPALSISLSMKGARAEGINTEIWMPPLRNGGKVITEAFKYYTQDTVPLSSIKDVDIYHIQGLWQKNNHKMALYARKNHKPYIITLRGMLYPQAFIGLNSFKKKLALFLYQKKDLQKAQCIQVTCEEEYKYYREMGFSNPVAIIPNPIETEGVLDEPIPNKEIFRFGFLGRLDPRKRVERLIYAFSDKRDLFKNAELVIIGSWDQDYEAFLKKEAERLSLSNVIFTGFLSGKAKDDMIKSLSSLVVPSDFENFGNIVTEALVRGVPVIASKGTPWKVLEDYECGWWISNDQKSINQAMVDFYNLSEDERITMGMNAKRLISEKFSLKENGKQLSALYRWVAGQESAPTFVHFE